MTCSQSWLLPLCIHLYPHHYCVRSRNTECSDLIFWDQTMTWLPTSSLVRHSLHHSTCWQNIEQWTEEANHICLVTIPVWNGYFPSSFGTFNHVTTLGGTKPLLLHERAWEAICTSQEAMAATKCWAMGEQDRVKHPEVVLTHGVSVSTLGSMEGWQLEHPQPQNTKASSQGFCIQGWGVSSIPLETAPTSCATNCLFVYICSPDIVIQTGNQRWLSW